MNEEVSTAVDAINVEEPPQVSQVPFFFFQKQKNKTTKLLANSGEVRPIDGRNVQYSFELKKPFFISYVEVSTLGYRDYDTFKFTYRNSDGDLLTDSVRPRDDKVVFEVADVCTEVLFTPPSAWFRTTKINEVRVFGFKRSDVASFIRFAEKVDGLKQSALAEINRLRQKAQSIVDAATQKESEAAGLQNQIRGAETRLQELRNEISTLTSNVEELIAKEGAAKNQLEAIEERISSIRSEISIETKKRQDIKNEANEEEAKLRQRYQVSQSSLAPTYVGI